MKLMDKKDWINKKKTFSVPGEPCNCGCKMVTSTLGIEWKVHESFCVTIVSFDEWVESCNLVGLHYLNTIFPFIFKKIK